MIKVVSVLMYGIVGLRLKYNLIFFFLPRTNFFEEFQWKIELRKA